MIRVRIGSDSPPNAPVHPGRFVFNPIAYPGRSPPAPLFPPFPEMAEIVTNAKARRDYEILETYEAGIVLHGTEVKALRAGRGQIADAFARVEKEQVWLYNAHIEEYAWGNLNNHAPKAPRKLLLNRNEIRKLSGFSRIKGHALVPLSLYWKNNRVKVALAVGRGKQQFDKREDLKRRDADRDLQRAISRHARSAR